ncbi:glycosyltransferase [Mesorhizobium sp. ES1-1]|uniref:glycosyltransferase n=1 Tax=Mesorhizobium sp. ES1-1 TaxID=2876629 RepID=UPI001CCBC5C6|nr:glycosyltransferase [Mesorhizobium sp. ES1-1]MBZ9678701.1 putative rhamnosyl transferase [Mesorhizobium sp. ES1-1]
MRLRKRSWEQRREARIRWLRRRSAILLWWHGPLRPNPQARIVLTVRYAVHFNGGAEGWIIKRKMTEEEHLAWLFDEARLAERLQFFTGILLPSLLSQDMPMQRGRRDLVVYVSEGVPAGHLAALQAALAGHDWARIVPVPMGAMEYPDVGPREEHAHLRIDDDDALSRDFLSRLSAFVRPAFHGHIITHPDGYFAGFDEAGKLILRPVSIPMVAMGIAYIVGPRSKFRSIYAVGPHYDAYRDAPTIIADARPAYIRTVHPGQSMYPLTKFEGDPATTLDVVRRSIEFDPEALRTSATPA